MRSFYFIPDKTNDKTPILLLFHGANRNPLEYLKEIKSTALEKNFIVVVPDFSDDLFLGVNGYQMGNIFEDGDMPSIETLNTHETWSLAFVKPIFEMVQKHTKSEVDKCWLLGHSGGAQFLHRWLWLQADIPFEKALISAAGWYTLPDTNIAFPYGLKIAPYDWNQIQKAFAANIMIQVGSEDNNPNASELRKGQADEQGIHRLSRAENFYNESKKQATAGQGSFNWQLKIAPGYNHSFGPAIRYGAHLMFD
jgi:poly(3-hydroxybutyrate) depolymerase